jgi:ketosteroid isomerase-like protein
MDHRAAQDWLDRYIAAWKSYDADAIAALFSDDVVYRYHPYDDPTVGRDAVVASWLGEDRDAPDTYDAEYAPVAVDGDVVVATGTTRYRGEPDGPVTRVFHNCFVMRFDGDGLCRDFVEYYTKED